MSDLQCAARVLLLEPTSADAAAHVLQERRPAALYLGTDDMRAKDGASALGATLGLPVRRVDDLTVSRFREGLAALADLHRGETVVALVDDDVLDRVEPSSSRELVLEVAMDADGWSVTPLVTAEGRPSHD